MTESGSVGAVGPGGLPADAFLTDICAIVAEAATRPGYAYSDTELLRVLRGVHRVEAMLAAVKLSASAEVATRPEAPAPAPTK